MDITNMSFTFCTIEACYSGSTGPLCGSAITDFYYEEIPKLLNSLIKYIISDVLKAEDILTNYHSRIGIFNDIQNSSFLFYLLNLPSYIKSSRKIK